MASRPTPRIWRHSSSAATASSSGGRQLHSCSSSSNSLASCRRDAGSPSPRPAHDATVRPFTHESLERLASKTGETRRQFGGGLPRRRPAQPEDGAVLPSTFSPFPRHMYGRPLEEFDRFILEETFCAVSRRFNKNYVHRFTATRSFFLFSPWNPIRRACIFLSTNQCFDYVVMATIISNCVFLALSSPPEQAEYIFLAIYSLEAVIKSIAKGFILNKYTYLRNPWNWLDFVVIVLGYVTMFIELGNLAGLRTFRVLRALKTVSIMPGLRTIINALLNSLTQLVEVMSLTLFCLMVFALFALQVFMGALRNKCVMTPRSPQQWHEYTTNETYWQLDYTGSFTVCGNGSGAQVCQSGFVCLSDIGDNPNFGYTNFDNFFWSMLTTFQLITLDFWEDVYNKFFMSQVFKAKSQVQLFRQTKCQKVTRKVIAAVGPWSILFFGMVVFFGSFYLINLMLAVVAMSYEDEAENTGEEKTKVLTDHRNDSTFSFDPTNLKLRHLDRNAPTNSDRMKERNIMTTYNYKKKRKPRSARPTQADASSVVDGSYCQNTPTPTQQIVVEASFPAQQQIDDAQLVGDSASVCTSRESHCISQPHTSSEHRDRQASLEHDKLRASRSPDHKRRHRSDRCDRSRRHEQEVDHLPQKQRPRNRQTHHERHEPHNQSYQEQMHSSGELYEQQYRSQLQDQTYHNHKQPRFYHQQQMSRYDGHEDLIDEVTVVAACDQLRVPVRKTQPMPAGAASPGAVSWLEGVTPLHPLRDSCDRLELPGSGGGGDMTVARMEVGTSVRAFPGSKRDEYFVHITTGQSSDSTAVANVSSPGQSTQQQQQSSRRRETLRTNMFGASVDSQGIGNSDTSSGERRAATAAGSAAACVRACSLDDSGVVGDQEESERARAPQLQTSLAEGYNLASCAGSAGVGVDHNSLAGGSRNDAAFVTHVVELPDALPDRNCDWCARLCCGYNGWLRCQSSLYQLVSDPCFDVFITLCIILNTLFLALEHHGMSAETKDALEIGNRVFTSIFTLECFLKISSSCKLFFLNGWNVFDLIVVVASVVELGLQNIKGLSVLRVLRLLRVLKLAQSWTTMRVLLSIIISSLGALGNLTFVLVIVIYIFAVIGMQLFADSYTTEVFAPDPIPRWNFTDFFHAFMMIFRILCGEWIEPLWDCMRAKGSEWEMCLAVFLPTLVMGNFLVLNLFLALLLNSFNCEELRSRKEEARGKSKLVQSMQRLRGYIHQKREERQVTMVLQAFSGGVKGKSTCVGSSSSAAQKTQSEVAAAAAAAETVPATCSDQRGRAVDGKMKMIAEEPARRGDAHRSPHEDRQQRQYHQLNDSHTINDSSPEFELILPCDFCPTTVSRDYNFDDDVPAASEACGGTCRHVDELVRSPLSRSLTPQSATSEEERSWRRAEVDNGEQRHWRPTRATRGRGRALCHRGGSSESDPDAMHGDIRVSRGPPRAHRADEFATCSRQSGDIHASSSNPRASTHGVGLRRALSDEAGYTAAAAAAVVGGAGGCDSSSASNWSNLASYVDTLRGKQHGDIEAAVECRRELSQEKAENDGGLDTEDEQAGLNAARAKAEKKVSREPPDCLPSGCYQFLPFFDEISRTSVYASWRTMRRFALSVVRNSYFEWTILTMIVASSVALCFEDKYLYTKPQLQEVLRVANLMFAILFAVEMLIKWVALGLRKYFSNAWTILDFIIVVSSIFSLAIEENERLVALRSLRTVRALRPLRAISRWQGMKIVVNALMFAIPSIFNVLLVCLVFWLIFSIMGVQFFSGQFYKCVDEDDNMLPIEVVNDKFQCFEKNLTWKNSKISFDHVGHAYLALLQVATFEGWMEVMKDATDTRGVNMQPQREANIYAYIYFVVFIVCGSFFTLNLFIGVIIDNFNMLKKKYEGGVLEMFLTDSQKNYYTALKKLGRKKPQKVIRRPINAHHAMFYDIAISRRFEIAIFILIFLNMVVMSIEHNQQPPVISTILEIFNIIFTTIFAMEALVKMIGLRWHYFTVPWNLFDFILVALSIMSMVVESKQMSTEFPVPPTLLRVVRVFRIGRILRLIKAAKGIRKLLFALIVSLPALFNIGALLFLIMFIYAIIGMALFANVKQTGVLNDIMNFETFANSMMLLFRLITSAGWNDVLDPLMMQPPECEFNTISPTGDVLVMGNCGQPVFAIIYFVTFIVINFMIVINMYIAVILENFNQAQQEEEIGIVEEDLEMFYVRWSKYDPHATQFINFTQLSDFVSSLDPPMGIAKPNTVALVSFDLPIAKGDKIHCLDILHALTKHVLGHVEETDEFRKLQEQMNEKFKKQFPTRKELEIVSSTRQWKQMDLAARVMQRSMKAFLQRRREMRAVGGSPAFVDAAHTQTVAGAAAATQSPMFLQRVASYLHVPALTPGRRSRAGSLASASGGESAGSSRRSSINLAETFGRIGMVGAGLPGYGLAAEHPTLSPAAAGHARQTTDNTVRRSMSHHKQPARRTGGATAGSLRAPPRVQIDHAVEVVDPACPQAPAGSGYRQTKRRGPAR